MDLAIFSFGFETARVESSKLPTTKANESQNGSGHRGQSKKQYQSSHLQSLSAESSSKHLEPNVSVFSIMCAVLMLLVLFPTATMSQQIAFTSNPHYIQTLVRDALQQGFDEARFLIERQFWFTLKGSQLETYSFQIKTTEIQYRLFYINQQQNKGYVYGVSLSLYLWEPQLKSYRIVPVAEIMNEIKQKKLNEGTKQVEDNGPISGSAGVESANGTDFEASGSGEKQADIQAQQDGDTDKSPGQKAESEREIVEPLSDEEIGAQRREEERAIALRERQAARLEAEKEAQRQEELEAKRIAELKAKKEAAIQASIQAERKALLEKMKQQERIRQEQQQERKRLYEERRAQRIAQLAAEKTARDEALQLIEQQAKQLTTEASLVPEDTSTVGEEISTVQQLPSLQISEEIFSNEEGNDGHQERVNQPQQSEASSENLTSVLQEAVVNEGSDEHNRGDNNNVVENGGQQALGSGNMGRQQVNQQESLQIYQEDQQGSLQRVQQQFGDAADSGERGSTARISEVSEVQTQGSSDGMEYEADILLSQSPHPLENLSPKPNSSQLENQQKQEGLPQDQQEEENGPLQSQQAEHELIQEDNKLIHEGLQSVQAANSEKNRAHNGPNQQEDGLF